MKRMGAVTAALAAGAVAAAIAVVPASGQDGSGTRTLTFTSTEKKRDTNNIDVKPKGDSVGDRFEFSSLLHSGGKVAGRVEAEAAHHGEVLVVVQAVALHADQVDRAVLA